LLDTLQSYLYEVQRMLIGQWKQANERPNAFVDHSGVLRDSRTGKPIEDVVSDEGSEHEQDDVLFGGFGFYDAGVDVTSAQRKRKIAVGECEWE
jgi:carnitine O-acetyltransferase